MIKISKISKQYRIRKSIFWRKAKDKVNALSDVNLEINDGEIIGLIGPNGAGKTTLIKLITGLLLPTEGKIDVNGFNPGDLSKSFKKQIGLFRGEVSMFDDGVIVKDSIEERLKIYKKESLANNENLMWMIKKLRASKILESTPESLSQGQRTIVEFINALCHFPSVILLDEPTNGLDIVATERINNLIKELRERFNSTIILTSHNLNNVLNISDRIVLINNGKVLLNDSEASIRENETGERTIHVELVKEIKDKSLEKLRNDIHGIIVSFNYPVLEIKSNKQFISDELKTLLDYVDVRDIKVIEPPVELIFSKYFE